jgi:hypothetical protein
MRRRWVRQIIVSTYCSRNTLFRRRTRQEVEPVSVFLAAATPGRPSRAKQCSIPGRTENGHLSRRALQRAHELWARSTTLTSLSITTKTNCESPSSSLRGNSRPTDVTPNICLYACNTLGMTALGNRPAMPLPPRPGDTQPYLHTPCQMRIWFPTDCDRWRRGFWPRPDHARTLPLSPRAPAHHSPRS